MKYAICALIGLACVTAVVRADSWGFPRKLIKKEFKFGEAKIVVEVDGIKDQTYPPHTLSVYAGDELLAKYKNVGVDNVFASKDNKFFVGVSNRGIPGTAFVVFDADGNLLREEKHRFLPPAVHTSQTVILARVWYDAKNPDVEFDVQGGRLTAVFIRGSNKTKYNLMERDLGVPRDSG